MSSSSMRSLTLEPLDSTSEKFRPDLEAQSTAPKCPPLNEHTLKAIADRTALVLTQKNHWKLNLTLDCDAHGLHYGFSTDYRGVKWSRITRITRWDVRREKDVLVAEWETNFWKADRLRWNSKEGGCDLMPANQWLHRTWGLPYTPLFNRSFTVGGKKYVWKSRASSLNLYYEDSLTGSKEEPIAKSIEKRAIIKPRSGFVELLPGYENILDELVVTWAIARKRRREGELWIHLVKFLIFDVMLTILIDVLASKSRNSR